MARLRVAIVHYHLRVGGVARVIQHAASVLADAGIKAVVLAGEPPPEPLPVECRIVPGLQYDQPGSDASAITLVAALCEAARAALGGAPDVWHFHNHSLGKSLALPSAVSRLAENGCRLLLQIHDFPEDGRPAAYRRLLGELGHGRAAALSDTLYPVGAHVHYAVLNGRDFSFMEEASTARRRLHFLPNCVEVHASVATEPNRRDPDGGGLVVYPTRGIRRKNLGEFLLWAAASGGNDRFVTTLAPKNPRARPVYDAWVRLAHSLGLPVEFGVAAKCNQSFVDILHSAKAIMSTSVAEGFGLAFLEPWLLGRPLLGRDLPAITGDFTAAGLDLGHLYERLDVPVEWVGREKLLQRIQTAQSRYHHDYGQGVPADAAARAFNELVRNDRVDFGRIDEPLQEGVIRRVFESRAARNELQPGSPFSLEASSSALIERNRQAVLREFNLSKYGERLLAIYRRIMESPADSSCRVSSEALLQRFLLPEQFSLLRTT